MFLAAALTACDGGAASGPSGEGGTGGSTPPLPAVPEVPEPHACGLQVSELAMFQGVKIPLIRDGVEVSARAVPIIEGRRAFFRAYLSYGGAPVTGNAVARLRIDSSAGLREFEATGVVADPSSEALLESSLNFDVPGDAIRPDARVSLTLHTGGSCSGGGAHSYPAGNGVALSPTDTGILKVVLVPIQYNADGSGRLPNLSEPQLQRYRDILLAIYPTRTVEVTVREPLATAVMLTASAGWPQLLEALREQRARDAAANDVYYYGLVEPAANFVAYCRNSCVAGLSYLVDNLSASRLVGLGVGFATGNIAGETLIHEIGHQHGRGHTPCGGGDGIDRNFPHADGGIGQWGLDIRTVPPRLQSPTSRKDLMGYCNPQWISDYTYAAVATRRTAISVPSASARLIQRLSEASEPHRTLVSDGAGQVFWGRPLTGEAPSGQAERAQVLDAAGAVVGAVTVFRNRFGHGSGASFDVPMPRPGWKTLVVPGLPPVDFTGAPAVPALEPALLR